MYFPEGLENTPFIFQNDKSETKKKIINVPQSVGFLDIQLDVHRSYRRNLDGCHSSIEKLSFDHWCIEILSNSVRPPHLGNQANGCIPNFYRSMYRLWCIGIDLVSPPQVFFMSLTSFIMTSVVEFLRSSDVVQNFTFSYVSDFCLKEKLVTFFHHQMEIFQYA